MSQKTNSTTLLYRNLEKQAGQYPVRAIRLAGKRPEPMGLLLIDDGIPEVEVASALAKLRVAELARIAKVDGDAICQNSAFRADDSCQVTVEERTQLWLQPRKTSRAALAK